MNKSKRIGGSIIVAVQEPDSRTMIKRVLQADGHEVMLARSVTEVRASLDLLLTDLMLVDIELPDDGAREIGRIAAAREEAAWVPVLMLAARNRSDDVRACLDAGADDVIARPFFAPELLARVRSLIRARQLNEAMHLERRDFEMLLEITRTLGSPATPEEILTTLVNRLTSFLGVERASIIVASRDPKWGYLAGSSDPKGPFGLQIDLRKYPEVRRTLESKKVLIIEDVQTSKVLAPLADELRKARIASLMVIPISPEGAPAATLLLHTRNTTRKFSSREVRLCAAAAEAAGAALRTARLFRLVQGPERS